jgi:hypothetical protein
MPGLKYYSLYYYDPQNQKETNIYPKKNENSNTHSIMTYIYYALFIIFFKLLQIASSTSA